MGHIMETIQRNRILQPDHASAPRLLPSLRSPPASAFCRSAPRKISLLRQPVAEYCVARGKGGCGGKQGRECEGQSGCRQASRSAWLTAANLLETGVRLGEDGREKRRLSSGAFR